MASLIFFGSISTPKFDVVVFLPKNTGLEFYRLYGFCDAVDPVLQLIKLYI